MEGGFNMNIRVIQVALLLMLNNAFLLLAVADIDFLNIALYGGWLLIIVAGIYLARANIEMVNDFNAKYKEQNRRYK